MPTSGKAIPRSRNLLPTTEKCDYCGTPLGDVSWLRPVGIEYDAIPRPAPIVKAWCGQCTPDDRMDAGAHHLLTRALRQR